MIPYTHSDLYLTYIWKNKFILKKSFACTNVSDGETRKLICFSKKVKITSEGERNFKKGVCVFT